MHDKVKQRLVGSLVLSGLVLIIMPLIFHNNIQNHTKITAPTQPQVEFIVVKQVGLLRAKQAELQQTGPSRQQAIQPALNPSVVEKVVMKPQGSISLNSAATIPAITSDFAPSVYGIQIASFYDQQHAKTLQVKLAKLKYKTIVVNNYRGKKRYYQVLVGPYPSQIEAKAVQAKLTSMLKLKGIVRTINATKLRRNELA